MASSEVRARERSLPRNFALVHFSGRYSIKVDIFRPGEYTVEDKMRAAETFLNGGTNLEDGWTD